MVTVEGCIQVKERGCSKSAAPVSSKFWARGAVKLAAPLCHRPFLAEAEPATTHHRRGNVPGGEASI